MCWLGRTGILTYEEELKRRGRALPEHVELARQNLSHAFHCVLPFDFTTSKADAQINLVVIDDREKLNQKIDILQSLQEIGIGLEVLHETSLPHRHDILSGAGDGEAEATAVGGGEKVEDNNQPAGAATDETPHGETQQSSLTSDDSSNGKESKAARMRLLCKALCTKLTPLDKQSGTRHPLFRVARHKDNHHLNLTRNQRWEWGTGEWEVIEKIMKSGSVTVIDAFAVERKGEAERYRPYANLPNRMLLYAYTT
jgi:hypothetical protein